MLIHKCKQVKNYHIMEHFCWISNFHYLSWACWLSLFHFFLSHSLLFPLSSLAKKEQEKRWSDKHILCDCFNIRTRQNSPTSQYVLFNKLSNIEPPPRRCTTARYMCLYIRKTDISPLNIGEVDASVYEEDWYLADLQRRSTCVCR